MEDDDELVEELRSSLSVMSQCNRLEPMYDSLSKEKLAFKELKLSGGERRWSTTGDVDRNGELGWSNGGEAAGEPASTINWSVIPPLVFTNSKLVVEEVGVTISGRYRSLARGEEVGEGLHMSSTSELISDDNCEGVDVDMSSSGYPASESDCGDEGTVSTSSRAVPASAAGTS